MQCIKTPLTYKQLEYIQKKLGDYVKVTVDIKEEIAVLGCELHADGEELLLAEGSLQDNIWGGGINMVQKEIDTTAVLNLRPSRGNASMEILNQVVREKFITIVKKLFNSLWEN